MTRGNPFQINAARVQAQKQLAARQSALEAMAQSHLQKRAVTLNPATRYKHLKAAPHLYSLIPYPYQFGNVNSKGVYQVSASTDLEGPDGILVPAGGVTPVTAPIRLESWADYHLLWAKFTAHNPSVDPSGDPPAWSRDIVLTAATNALSGILPFEPSTYQRIPYTSYIEASIFFDVGARDYYGGPAKDAQTRAFLGRVRTPLYAIQSRVDGVGQIRMDAQLAASGVVIVEFINKHPTANLRVTGHLFGYDIL